MALKGKAKKDYQRNYMRKRRAIKVAGEGSARIKGLLDPSVRPQVDADGNPVPNYDC